MRFQGLKGFDWDQGNLGKVMERMEPTIAELAFQGSPLVGLSQQHSGPEERYYLINQVGDRWVFVIFTIRHQKIRVISARYMHKRELKCYEKEK